MSKADCFLQPWPASTFGQWGWLPGPPMPGSVGAVCGLLIHSSVRSDTGQPLLSETIRRRRLSFFGHLCRADANQDHSRALQACIRGPPKDWRRRTGRPRQTWLRTVEDDLRPLNFGLASARQRAWDRPAWHTLMEAATSSWHAPKKKKIHRTCSFLPWWWL